MKASQICKIKSEVKWILHSES